MEIKDYYYRCTIYREVLANREQEFKRNHSKSDYESKFFEDDDHNALRWIKDVTISFSDKDLDNFKKRIQFEYNNELGKKQLIISEDYVYFIGSNCLIDNEILLHRDKIVIEHKANVDITENELNELVTSE